MSGEQTISDGLLETLFNHIKNNNIKQFIDLVNIHTDNIDFTTKDKSGNYLITYAVRHNYVDAAKLILRYGGRCDIIDKLGRSLLFEIVDNGSIEMGKTFLEYSDQQIGVSIIDVRDIQGNIPLHYAIKNNDFDFVKLLIHYRSDPNIRDINGMNSLHIAAKIKNEEIHKIIINNISTIDQKTKKGKTALYIAVSHNNLYMIDLLISGKADLNTQESEHEFTSLHRAIMTDNHQIISRLISAGVQHDIQDIFGYTPLMYSLIRGCSTCFDALVRSPSLSSETNIWNIHGKIALHYAFEKYQENNSVGNVAIKRLIEFSDLAIQDNDGFTCLDYLIRLGLWSEYSGVLVNKRLNIFTKNSNNERTIDTLIRMIGRNAKEFDSFIDIVVQSYINGLKNKKWKKKKDNLCNHQPTDEEIKSFIKKSKKKYSGNKADTFCFRLIKDFIISCIDEPDKKNCNKSYPTSITKNIVIEKHLEITTFMGTLFDLFFGLHYILRIHKNACTIINVSDNTKKREKYDNYNMIFGNYRIDIGLKWYDQLLIPIDGFVGKIKKAQNDKYQFIIIPLGIKVDNNMHSNILIYDTINNEIERFEPHGSANPPGMDYNYRLLDDLLETMFLRINQSSKYIRPQQYIQKIGFQLFESQEVSYHHIGDPDGFCVLWCLWYTDQRIRLATHDRHDIMNHLFDSIKINNLRLKNVIRNYSYQIIKQRDSLLKKVGLSINDWKNDIFSNEQASMMISFILDTIHRCKSFIN